MRHMMRHVSSRLAPRLDRFWTAFALLAAVTTLVAAGCTPRPRTEVMLEPDHVLEIVAPDRWPLLMDDLDPGTFAAATERALPYLEALPATEVLSFGGYEVTAEGMAQALRRTTDIVLRIRDPQARTEALKEELMLVRSVGRSGVGEVLFTGYFEPIIKARRTADGRFVQPLYEVPEDLVTVDLQDFGLASKRLVGRLDGRRLVPYPDRHAIDADRALDGRAEILAFLEDPVEAFLLHVQGSGQLRFEDGTRLRAGYAATNGHPYRSIGKLLIDEDLVPREEMSMQAIVDYLAAHPEEVRRVLDSNPSYVFFRPLPADDGPLGCYGVPLTAGRSIATDRRLFPAPAVAWIKGRLPSAGGGDEAFARLAVNLDTGGIIKGPDRVDLFFGQGDEAGALAGRTTHVGELYFLLPRRSAQ